MNLHVFCIHISIMLLLQHALSKTLPEAIDIDGESEVSDLFDDTQSNYDEKGNRLKGLVRRRRASEEKSSIKKPCAVMYKNDEPVGVLQPYKDTYQFLPLHSEEHIDVDISPYSDSQNAMKRDTKKEDDDDVSEARDEDALKKDEDGLKFSDDRYPYIFAKFKVDSRIEKPYGNPVSRQKTLHKRDSDQSLTEEKHSDSLSSTLSKIQTNADGAEVELRSILSDMGLIDDEMHIDKREAELNEDEDLEHGTNKINLIKLDNIEERPKRDDAVENPEKRESATKHYEMIEIPEPKTINEEEYIDQYLNKNEDQPGEHDKKDVEKRSDHVADKIEREIKSKLQKIKEEVRNEIQKIKTGNNEEAVDEEEEDEDQTQEKDKLQRRKRHAINTLTDEETSDINPVFSAGNNLVPHIRRRRKRGILIDDISDDKEDLRQQSKISKNKAQLLDLPVDSKTISTLELSTETNLIIDLNPETKSPKDPNNVRQNRRPDKDSRLEITQERKKPFKTNAEIDQRTGRDERDEHERVPEHPISMTMNNWKRMPFKSNDVVLDRLHKLENLPYRSIRSITENLTVNLPYESTRPTNEYLATTENHFLMRVLQEFDDDDETRTDEEDDANFETNDDANDNPSAYEDTNLNRDKKSCKCSNGGKDCAKCGKAPLRMLQGSDGTNFVYIDDVPRLADGPPSFKVVNEKETHDDKENPTVKIKFMPVPPDKKRSTNDYKNYRKSVIKFQKSLLDGKYILDIDPDIYRLTEENSKSVASMRKRRSFSDLVSIHGGGPVINHLVAIRERSMLPRIRVKRSPTKDQTSQQLTLADMSDEDLFGALPQGFEGELARYKRVKRTD